jgi:hypothetical protein
MYAATTGGSVLRLTTFTVADRLVLADGDLRQLTW